MQLELLPEATCLEKKKAGLKARIRKLYRRVRDTGRDSGQLSLNLVHTVGAVTGRMAQLVKFIYRGLNYRVLKSPEDPRSPMSVIDEVLGFEVGFHNIYFSGCYPVSI